MSSVSMKPEFGYVLGVAGASFFAHHMYMASKVVKARKRFGVEYPALYADEKNCPNETNRKTFNCVQRAHQNSLENQAIFLSLLTLSGLQVNVTSNSDRVKSTAVAIEFLRSHTHIDAPELS
eukprot:GHUV01046207.1.p2 GENE.GHUV01046207.1~~GHUV01046207.1.p2  ORF type:complete len:122 (-),score=15.15 GHUV01046207.1:609-974(-)